MFARKNRVSAAFYDFFSKENSFLRLYLKAESTNTIKYNHRITYRCRLLCMSLKNHALKGQDSLPKPSCVLPNLQFGCEINGNLSLDIRSLR